MNILNVAALPLAGTQLIEASAGTGKTHAITSLFLRLVLEQQLGVDRILVVTFTNAATDELRGKIRQRLLDALHLLTQPAQIATEPDSALRDILLRCHHAADGGQRLQHLRAQTTAMDDAAIFTIHGFCQRVLAEYAFDSGSIPAAELSANTDALLRQAVADWWRQRFYTDAAAARFAAGCASLRTPGALLACIRPLLDCDAQLDVAPFDARRHAELPDAVRNAWRQEGVDLLNTIREQTAAGYLSKAKDTLREDMLAQAAAAMDAFSTDIAAQLPDHIALRLRQSFLVRCVSQKAHKAGIAVPAFNVAALLDELHAQNVGFEHALLIDAVACVRRETTRLKERAGVLGFDDLIRHLRDALTRDANNQNGNLLAARIAAQYPAALIDEFQDTDPAQYAIFHHIYAQDHASRCLLMIGDPKQAIYSFRGADIFAYINAKQATPPANRHTLGTNWRSVKPLVAAINHLFGRLGDASFLYPEAIGFDPVAAAGQADQNPLLLHGRPPVPLLFDIAPAPEKKNHNKEDFRALAANATAARIADLLNAAQAGQATIAGRALTLRDIAVLVRSHREGAIVQQALRALGVGSAIASQNSVYATVEAEDLAHVMAAMIEPGNDALLRRALASSLWRYDAHEISALNDDEIAAETLRERIANYHRRWIMQGFMPMFRQWLHREDIPARLERGNPAEQSAERTLTNLLQLAELLQIAAREYATPEALLRYLVEARHDHDNRGEEQQLHLESDENLVQIVTQHKSKGLQYPVVFLPSLATVRKPDDGPPTTWHNTRQERMISLRDDAQAQAIAARERLAEEVRMAYVALTRAQYWCVVACGAVSDNEHSALSWLLHGDGDMAALDDWPSRMKRLGHAELRATLDGLVAAAPASFAIGEMPAAAAPFHPQGGNATPWQARTANRRIEQNWRQTSFSALADYSAVGAMGPSYNAEGTRDPDITNYDNIVTFPRGRKAGHFFHALLETMNFSTARGDTLRATIRDTLARYAFSTHWLPALERMITDVLNTPIDADGLTLRALDATQLRREMEFFYPLQNLHANRLDALLSGRNNNNTDPDRLRFLPVTGLMHGFIDLVFAHNGRYYLADWKSNWLGPTAADYGTEQLTRAINEHHYDLQYCVYSVALHHYLQARIPDYDIDRHFGGVYYFFLRGMRPGTGSADGPATGVYFRRAPRAEILSLAAIMRNETTP